VSSSQASSDPLSRFRLDGRTAVITGIGPGIGEHVARAFAEVGANVVLFARTAARVEALAASINDDGGKALAVAGDVGRAADVDRLIAAAQDRFGIVQVVFHNAFAGPSGALGAKSLDLTDEDWQAALGANLLAPFRMARAFVPGMREAGSGSFINVLSTAAFTPIPGIAAMAYGATKRGLETATRYLAMEAGPEIRANCICPGTISATDEPLTSWTPAMLAKVPLRRIGHASEVVGAALYLASDASSFVTGQTIYVDGGRVNAGSGS
jgi:NAD(P)-dependent dehydrogenase (short-subunit alcohol dehydrogenase family)